MDEVDWRYFTKTKIDEIVTMNYNLGIGPNYRVEAWDFANAFVFCISTTTTIGMICQHGLYWGYGFYKYKMHRLLLCSCCKCVRKRQVKVIICLQYVQVTGTPLLKQWVVKFSLFCSASPEYHLLSWHSPILSTSSWWQRSFYGFYSRRKQKEDCSKLSKQICLSELLR